MSEDAPVNTGAVSWPDPYPAGIAVRRMQTKLHLWAARDPGRCFGDLFNLVYDPAFLVVAWERVAANKGASTPGIDKATVAGVEARDGVIGLLGCIREELKSGSFRPVEVRRVLIPKSNGKLRKLGIPTLVDRVVQASLKLVLEPIFEADFKPCSYGFRPNRRAQDAISDIHHLASRPSNYQWVLEADIKACFDEISHTALMDRVRVRVRDKRVCALVKAFLKAGVLTELGDREETHTGTPQGGSATRGRTCMSGPHRWRSVMLAEVWSQASARGPVLALTCVAGNGGVRSSGESRRLLVHPGEYGREEDRTGEPREPSLMPRDCGPLPGGCGWQGFRAGRCEAAGAGRDIPFRPGGHHRPGVKKAPSPIGTHACGTWKPRRGPAVTAGRPTVREAEAPGGTGWPKKLMPVAERQQETGTTWLAPSLAVPDNWPDTGCCPDLKGC